MGASGTITFTLETETLNQFENGPIILAHKQNFPFCARDMLLGMHIAILY